MQIPYRLNVLLNKLVDAGCGPIRVEGKEFRCRCPAHQDNGPSLYVRVKKDKILLKCNAECTTKEVCNALDHDVKDLFLAADEELVECDAIDPAGEEFLAGGSGTEPAACTETSSAAPPGAVYADLLDQLELSTAHFHTLTGRGLTAQQTKHRGYRTANASKIRKAIDALLKTYSREDLLTVPGFYEKGDKVSFVAGKGMLIPVRDLTDKIVALKIRHDANELGKKYTWASTKANSCGSPVHVPLGISGPVEVVRLTEGELKADVATSLSAVPTISSPGVSNWRLAVPVLKEMGAKTVYVAFDQDDKPGTLAVVEKALKGLTHEGFEVELEWWEGKLAKGIDDLLAMEHQPTRLTGLAALLKVQDATTEPASMVLESDEPTPAPFPVDVFPPDLVTYCNEMAAATCSPPDFVGQTMLVVAGAAIGNSRALCIKPNVWYEAPRFYAVCVGDPASGKTPAMEAVIKPYQTMQLRLLTAYSAEKAIYDEAQRKFEDRCKENRSLSKEERLPIPEVPPIPQDPERFIADNATVESLAILLQQNPRGLLMPQDEGVAWVRGMGQYKGGKGNDRQFWLSSWSGKGHIVDRKSQGVVPVSIPRPFLNVICGLPPDMLNELADIQGRNDGFLHRVLFAIPAAPIGAEWTEQTVSPAAQKTWAATLEKLRGMPMEVLEDGVLGHKAVQFTTKAKKRWVEWWDQHAAEIRGDKLPAPLIGPWGKLKSYAARLALVLHFLWNAQKKKPADDLNVNSLNRAITLIDYYKTHLRVVYSRLRQTPEENHLNEVIDWIRKRGGRCTARDLANAKKVTPTDKAKKVMTELVERGYGRLECEEAKNHRKVNHFILDPGTASNSVDTV